MSANPIGNPAEDELYISKFAPTFPDEFRSTSDGPVTESRVLIIMTGGTICMVPSPSGLVPASDFLATHLVPRPSFNDTSLPSPLQITSYTPAGEAITTPSLRTPLSRHNRHVLYTVQEFSPLLDSSSVSSPSWHTIANALKLNYDHFDAFIILHGTDSMAYTSSALSFILANLSKPVILTGSQAPFSQLHTDATDNLLGALIIAGHHPIPEVGLFFHHNLYRGNRATKVSASDFAAFASPNMSPLAEVSATGVHINWNLVLRMPPLAADGSLNPLEVDPGLDTAHTACLRLFPGITSDMVDAIIRVKPIVGLVLETFGAGNAPQDGALVNVLADAVKRDVVIVNVTQCLKGSVNPLYEAGKKLVDVGVVPGRDMTSEAALTKLAWCLARGWGCEGARREMGRCLRGEMSNGHS